MRKKNAPAERPPKPTEEETAEKGSSSAPLDAAGAAHSPNNKQPKVIKEFHLILIHKKTPCISSVRFLSAYCIRLFQRNSTTFTTGMNIRAVFWRI
ncbi:MAG: hypothetical protein GY820_28705 [Gammaproteobacteria bacterium]|nr:hypothetical protein [Gammaproteobacteria bacterium]